MTKKNVCGNPLYLQIQTEAESKDRTRTSQAYRKACTSIRSCPIPYDRPSDLICLNHVGPILVKLLEKKEKEYYRGMGLAVPERRERGGAGGGGGGMEEEEIEESFGSVAGSSRAGQKRKRPAQDPSDPINAALHMTEEEIDSGILPPSPPNKKKKTTKAKAPAAPKVYVPKQRSGAYAILLALHAALPEEYKSALPGPPGSLADGEKAEWVAEQDDQITQSLQQAQLTKQEIITAGKAYTDLDFEGRSEAGSFYNAWSSMKTLIGKELVLQRGRPSRYYLTREGLGSASAILGIVHGKRPGQGEEGNRRIDEVLNGTEGEKPKKKKKAEGSKSVQKAGSIERIRTPSPPPVRSGILDDFSSPLQPMPEILGAGREGQSSNPAGGQLAVQYIDPNGNPVKAMQDAASKTDLELGLAMRKIQIEAKHLAHLQAGQLRNLSQVEGVGMLFQGWILEMEAPPFSAVRGSEEVSGGAATTSGPVFEKAAPTEEKDADLSFESDKYGSDGFDSLVQDIDMDNLLAGASAGPVLGGRKGLEARSQTLPVLALPGPHVNARDLQRTGSLPNGGRLMPGANAEAGPSRPISPANDAPTSFDISTATVFPPGSYDIILVMDSREIKNRRDEEAICKGLRDKGIMVEVRGLRVGDVTWIARSRDPAITGHEKEVVLDYVVERKRLDDLCSSIRDGRYDEQKYRLKQSGLKHVYYVVEDWDVERFKETSALQIATAKSQTQIVNGFYLKETHKLSETIEFLRLVTENIQEILANKQIRVIPERHVTRATYLAIQSSLQQEHPDKLFHTTFETFQSINSKSSNLTTAETFPRLLMCVKGMSNERVAAMVKTWPTCRDMWDAYRKREKSWKEEKRKEELELNMGIVKKKADRLRDLELFFADALSGDGRQKIGDALSRELYSVFFT